MDQQPKRLFDLSTGAVIQNFKRIRPELELCPQDWVFAFFYELFKRKDVDLLAEGLKSYQIFSKLLKVGDRRANLHQMLAAATEYVPNLPGIIAQRASDQLLNQLGGQANSSNTIQALKVGFNLGGFLCEAGCYPAGTAAHKTAVDFFRKLNQKPPNYLLLRLESLSKLLHSYSCSCQVGEAREIYQEMGNLVNEVEMFNLNIGDSHNLAATDRSNGVDSHNRHLAAKDCSNIGDSHNLAAKDSSYVGDSHNLAAKDSSYVGDSHNLAAKDSSNGVDFHNLAAKDSSNNSDSHNLAAKDSSNGGESYNLAAKDSSNVGDSHNQAAKDSSNSRDHHNLAAVYSEFSFYNFMISQFHVAYEWSMKAVSLLSLSLSPKLIIDVLRQASNACVVKGEFSKAKMLITEAMSRAKEIYGERHAKYADCLIDYGFYLANDDRKGSALPVYRNALEVRLECFGANNLQVAVADRELANAILNTCASDRDNSDKLNNAKAHAEKSLNILNELLPSNHLLLASSKDVLARANLRMTLRTLYNREIGLEEAERLELCALQSTGEVLGECNVQTANSYSNLGSIYHAMSYMGYMAEERAEEMFVRAIAIMESLLGSEAYQLMNPLVRLANLYRSRHMQKDKKAEDLYLRAIEIGSKLFGPSYSLLGGLYEGLIFVYHELANEEMFQELTTTLQEWKALRDERDADTVDVFDEECRLSLDDLIQAVRN